MPDGTSHDLSPADSMAAPWFADLPDDHRETLEWWVARFQRTETRLLAEAAPARGTRA
jgi:hypothetical protein